MTDLKVFFSPYYLMVFPTADSCDNRCAGRGFDSAPANVEVVVKYWSARLGCEIKYMKQNETFLAETSIPLDDLGPVKIVSETGIIGFILASDRFEFKEWSVGND